VTSRARIERLIVASPRRGAILGIQVSQPLEDPRAELEALAHATRRAARRQQALGRRELPRSRKKSPAAAPVDLASPAKTAADVRAQAAAAPDLATLRACVSHCEACGLSKTRTQTVFMDGQGTRKLMFVGEAPGADEDRQGVPFVGRAGQLLTEIITKGMGISRDEVTIANVLKCRPPENREPTPAEKATCTPWLDRQIELVDPTVIVPLGRHAAMHVLRVEASMGAMRARVHALGGRQIVPTYHPAYLLRSPGEKKECWKDIQLAMGVLGMPVPARSDGGSASGGR
jgi:DNA polymerase